jgi:hypothetical protein
MMKLNHIQILKKKYLEMHEMGIWQIIHFFQIYNVNLKQLLLWNIFNKIQRLCVSVCVCVVQKLYYLWTIHARIII